jgi:hypothetical protein
VTTSILGSSLEHDLVKRGRFVVIADPLDPTRRIGLVAAMRPDLAFVHVPAADARGCAIAPLPHGEGPWGALAAVKGIVVTAERIVSEDVIARAPEAICLPPHRVLAICEAPFGAHPQSLFSPRELDLPAYGDDFDAYELLREVALDDRQHAGLVDDVLLGTEDVYARHFDLARRAPFLSPPPSDVADRPEQPPSQSDQLVILAARRIMKIVQTKGYRIILAGVGHAFFASRLAKLLLERKGVDVDVLVETGMYGIDCGPASGSFLLGFNVIANARRLSSIEDALGAITCGAGNGCIGVLGAAQVDARGNLNSTRLADGTLLVGSGGANDIASAADEVVVLASCDRNRLVNEIPYITSPGRRVYHVITEEGVLCRDVDGSFWRIEDVPEPPAYAPAHPGASSGSSGRAGDAAPLSSRSDELLISPPSSRTPISAPPSSRAPISAPPSSRTPMSVPPASDPLSWRDLRGMVPSRRRGFTVEGDEWLGARLRRVCPWPIARRQGSLAAPPTAEERALLDSLNRDRRARKR